MRGFPEKAAAALVALRTIWGPEHFIVVGAVAIGHHIGLQWRGTIDLDLSVSADVDAYTRDLESLAWRRDRAALQRWVSPENLLVDVIPASPSLIVAGGFTWPDGSARMNLVGFRLAFADAVSVEVAPGVMVRVASLRSLVVLKMSAYLDRPWERDTDLADIAHILPEFVEPDADERWSLEVIDLEIDYDDVSPFLLGRHLAAVVDDAERALVGRFLAAIEDPADRIATLTRMARQAPAGLRNPEELRARIETFRRGFES